MVALAQQLCDGLDAPRMCAMLHDRIWTIQKWETQADLGLALFVIISLLAFATGGGGAAAASQADQGNAIGRTKRFAKYGAAAATLVGVLTVIQNTLLPADFGTLSAVAKRGKRYMEGILSVLDEALPTDRDERKTLIENITKQCSTFDELDQDLKHQTISLLHVSTAHAQAKTTPWTDLNSDKDRLCFLGIGVSNTLSAAREAAVVTARGRLFDFFMSNMMKAGAPYEVAEYRARFVMGAGKEANTTYSSRYDTLDGLYRAFSRFCVGRLATAEGLAALEESLDVHHPATKHAADVLKTSPGLPDAYYERQSRVSLAVYKQAQALLSPEQLNALLDSKIVIMAGRGATECDRLKVATDRCYLRWELVGLACLDVDPEAAEGGFRRAIEINATDEINGINAAAGYATLLLRQNRRQEATAILLDARKLDADDPWLSWVAALATASAGSPSGP